MFDVLFPYIHVFFGDMEVLQIKTSVTLKILEIFNVYTTKPCTHTVTRSRTVSFVYKETVYKGLSYKRCFQCINIT